MDDMVQAIVDRYASVISTSLDVIDNSYRTNDRINRKVLKHDIFGPSCSAKTDINGYQKLMKAYIKQWCQVEQKHHDEYSGLDVYFMYEENQTERRLKLPQGKGLLGRCRTVDLMPVHTAEMASAKHPDVPVVRAVAELVGYVGSDEACIARRAAQYGAGTKMLVPDVPMRQLWSDTRKLYGRRAKMKVEQMKTSTPMLCMQETRTN